MTKKTLVSATINGERVEFLCEPRQTLLEVLRETLGLTGTKQACSNGNCGACNVILDGMLVNSCLVLAEEIQGRSVTTIEGIAPHGGLHPLQQKFLEHAALQCGICTPGFIVAAKALLDRNPHPSEAEVRHWLAGNLCRCTGYDKIVRAVLDAAGVLASPPAAGEPASTDARQEPPGGAPGAYRVIGTRPINPAGPDKVTGRALYGADVRLPNMLYGAVLRSPHAHAAILSIDTTRAAALPGVTAVVTAANLADLAQGGPGQESVPDSVRYRRENALAHDRVLYYGHPVAAVAATNPHVAAEALALIDVRYDMLPAVLDVRQAMAGDAPILHPDLRTDEFGLRGDHPTNVAKHLQMSLGDVEAGFREAAVIVEREFHTATVHQGYIEPQNATAQYRSNGELTVWCSTQGPFGVRDQLVEILQIPLSRIRVNPLEIGGGFGGKNDVYLEPLAALLSYHSDGRPVKLAMSHADVLAATGPAPASYIRARLGVDATGRITAAQAYLAYEAGAYPGSFLDLGMTTIFGAYRIPNARIDGYDVVVNKPRAAAYRAPGAPNALFAGETIVDEVCEQLGMDPLEFRLLNAIQQGDRRPNGLPSPGVGSHQTLRAAADHPHYRAPLGGPNRGRGVACVYWANYSGKSSASACVNADGTVNLLEGSVDLASSRVAIAMQLAETLGIPLADIGTAVGDTASVGYTEGSYGSRTTFATGWAVYELGQKLLRLLAERAASLWDVAAGQVGYVDGWFTDGSRRLTFKELAARLDETGGPVVASASVWPQQFDPAFATHIVDVEVDPETGKVQILRYTAVQDVGTAVHPSYLEGQIQGGITQGIGWGLSEEYVYDAAGHLRNASFLDYRIPTSYDLPMIEPVLVEVPSQVHPFHVRGAGETPIVPPAAALANAIYRAVGVRLDTLPMSPPRILEKLWAKESRER